MSDQAKSNSQENLLAAITAQLRHPYIRERKAGIKQAAELISIPEYRIEIYALLEDLAANDPIGTVRQAAQAVLEKERNANRFKITTGKPEDYFGARCPNGHISYYKKSQYCRESGVGYRGTVVRGGETLDKIVVQCKTCREKFEVEVNCKGYKNE